MARIHRAAAFNPHNPDSPVEFLSWQDFSQHDFSRQTGKQTLKLPALKSRSAGSLISAFNGPELLLGVRQAMEGPAKSANA
jgi:hypothetical protein